MRITLPSLRRLIAVAKLIVLVLVTWGLWHAFYGSYDELLKLPLRPSRLNWTWLSASAGLYFVAQIPFAMFWRQILNCLGLTVGVWKSFRAFFIGHVGKYVPSKLMVVALRSGLVTQLPSQLPLAATSVFVETLTTMMVGALLAASVAAGTEGVDPRIGWTLLVSLLLCAVLCQPAVIRAAARLVLAGRWSHGLASALDRITYRLMLSGWAWILLGWTLMAASLLAAATGLANASGPDWTLSLMLRMLAAVSMSVVAGFVSFLPGGLMVREWVLAQLLAPLYGEAMALAIPVVLRVIWLLTETVGAGILYVVRRVPSVST